MNTMDDPNTDPCNKEINALQIVQICTVVKTRALKEPMPTHSSQENLEI